MRNGFLSRAFREKRKRKMTDRAVFKSWRRSIVSFPFLLAGAADTAVCCWYLLMDMRMFERIRGKERQYQAVPTTKYWLMMDIYSQNKCYVR